MQAKVKIGAMRRARHMPHSKLFLGDDPKQEVRTQWSSLYQAFHRNKFLINIEMAQVTHGGRSIEDITQDYGDMFSRMEEWCDANCTGLWSISDNEDEQDRDAMEASIDVHFMFEVEEDLIQFTRDCAVMMKLTY